MSEGGIIVDTGPLVAFLVKEEIHHDWARTQLQELDAPFLSSVFTLDSDFKLYRKHGRQTIPLIMPPER